MTRLLLYCFLIASAVLLTGTGLTSAQSAAPASSADADPAATAAADAQFRRGDFEDSARSYAQAAAFDARNVRAAMRLGDLAMMANRFDSARAWLSHAKALAPTDPAPDRLLAECDRRQDRFTEAARLLRASGSRAQADQLASFIGQTPYAIDHPERTVVVKFVRTEPLPVVQVKVNGSAAVNFFIDTGASEMVVDTDFAKQVGAVTFGEQMGVFAGGRQAPLERGRIQTAAFGDMTVRNIPVLIMPVSRLSQIFGGMRIEGIIGTVLLYHFLSTLDYPKGELVLAPKASSVRPSANAIPFWMAGDHFMVAHGTLNGGPACLFLVDTGLAGGGFSAPEDTLAQAGIMLNTAQTAQGVGGGGAVPVTPFTVDTLTLGTAVQHNIQGLTSGPFPFEDSFGFHVSGLISHGFFRAYAVTFDFTNMRMTLN